MKDKFNEIFVAATIRDHATLFAFATVCDMWPGTTSDEYPANIAAAKKITAASKDFFKEMTKAARRRPRGDKFDTCPKCHELHCGKVAAAVVHIEVEVK